ncbi:hypothetical protein BT96DRAFT_1005630 [Gymnopus androsaceus JB14]|uniref:ABC transporter domain-containing protein n=1 Tax=Gymnopus androsaceus JB14 TaxID=1447944 RepID=A0A6A4GMC6_9AGAR|nr:hypothetical protein BT96DRAFT_1005630 [Gymnopus androsaceus JB14]
MPVGDTAIRGVSGGEKKHASIAEALATRMRFGSWDNSTHGLDLSIAQIPECGRFLQSGFPRYGDEYRHPGSDILRFELSRVYNGARYCGHVALSPLTSWSSVLNSVRVQWYRAVSLSVPRTLNGYYGAMLPAALNVFSQIGWPIIISIVSGQVLAAASTHLNDTAGIFIIVIISFMLSFCGYKALHWYEPYIWVPSVALFIALLGVGGKQLAAQIPILNASSPAATAGMLIAYETTAGASDLTWCSFAADEAKAPTWKIFSWAYGGIFTSAFAGHILSAAFSAAAPAVSSWETGLGDGEDFGRFLVAILEPIGGFGKFIVLPLLKSFLSPSLGLLTFFTVFEDVLNLIGYWATSYSSIVLCEHFIFWWNDFSRYHIPDWNTPSNLPETFSWKSLDYVVPVPDGHGKLLDDVSGFVVPGKLTALMGESGAGKKTLLNVFAQWVSTGVVTGDMLVSGQPLPNDVSGFVV